VVVSGVEKKETDICRFRKGGKEEGRTADGSKKRRATRLRIKNFLGADVIKASGGGVEGQSAARGGEVGQEGEVWGFLQKRHSSKSLLSFCIGKGKAAGNDRKETLRHGNTKETTEVDC